ncbi:hypothetical protein WJ438_38395 [Streptomyces sp. GD-15H]|uniref:hypothetical protein n=1 Tax=Streptomyces sp. GD-15H TaxID=3129112 RepID=UPI0032564FDE
MLTARGHQEARLLLPREGQLSALRKLELDAAGNSKSGEEYDEHAAAATSTVAVLTGPGSGSTRTS